MFVKDGSFLRLRNITLATRSLKTYQFIKIQKIRIYLSAENLLTLTKYRGFDPEIAEVYLATVLIMATIRNPGPYWAESIFILIF